MKLFDKLFPSGDASVTELLPFSNCEEDCFRMRDHSIMDILEIVCKDLAGASEEAVEYDLLCFEKLYKTFGDDCKIISLNFPTDTLPQQTFVQHKIEATQNEVYKGFLQQKLAELQYIEQHRTNREYYLFLFFESMQKRNDGRITIGKSLGDNGLVKTLSLEKKKDIIFKICNMSTRIS